MTKLDSTLIQTNNLLILSCRSIEWLNWLISQLISSADRPELEGLQSGSLSHRIEACIQASWSSRCVSWVVLPVWELGHQNPEKNSHNVRSRESQNGSKNVTVAII